jgi:hypothetical protein
MCAAVIPCVAAYLLIHAFGKEVLNDAYFWGPFSHTLSYQFRVYEYDLVS